LKKRVVIAGFGDTGLLAAIHLGSAFDIVGISPKPCLVSGQELGARLTRPEEWQSNYLMDFSRYKKLDGVRTIQGLIKNIDAQNNHVSIEAADGELLIEHYDVLLIASGVSNGFWRTSDVESLEQIKNNIHGDSQQLDAASSVAVIGGGATGVSAAVNLAEKYSGKQVDFFYSGSQPLPGYHPKVRGKLVERSQQAGVKLHPNHRAIIPDSFNAQQLSRDKVEWQAGQPSFFADVTLWATGSSSPNNNFIDPCMLDDKGFVNTDSDLRVTGHDNIFCVGDIAASDPNRSSARNGGYALVAKNITAFLNNRPDEMKRYSASNYRWGSILGLQHDGLRVFSPSGGNFRFPRWFVDKLLFPFIVKRKMYHGVRELGEHS
jgi:NADH dehydrogenase FAD-containing subunit